MRITVIKKLIPNKKQLTAEKNDTKVQKGFLIKQIKNIDR